LKEIPFSIPLSGVVRIDEDSVVVIVNKTETNISLSPVPPSHKRLFKEQGKTMFDVVLEAAREVVRKKGVNRFSPPELYREALLKYPQLRRNSFMSRVIACTPNHNSYKHHASTRDYLYYMTQGVYTLRDEYTKEEDGTSITSQARNDF
jgi:hypothetical protein